MMGIRLITTICQTVISLIQFNLSAHCCLISYIHKFTWIWLCLSIATHHSYGQSAVSNSDHSSRFSNPTSQIKDLTALQHLDLNQILQKFSSPQTTIAGGISLGSYLIHQEELSKSALTQIEAWLVNQLRFTPTDIQTHYYLCITYLKISRTQPKSSLLWNNYQNHYFQKAIKLAYQITLLDSNHLFTRLIAAYIAFYLGDPQGALITLKAINHQHKNRPIIAESYHLYSQIINHLPANQLTELTRFMKIINSQNFLPPTVYAQIINRVLIHLPHEEALQWIRHKHQTVATQQQSQWRGALAYLYAKAYLLHGYEHKAQQLFEQALSTGWHNSDLTLSYSSIIFKTQPHKIQQLSQFQHHLGGNRLDTQWDQQWYLGLSYLYLRQYHRAATTVTNHLISVYLHTPQAAQAKLMLITKIYQSQNLAHELIKLLQQLTIHLPQLTNIHALLAEVYTHTNQPQLAQKYWHNALIFAPTNHHYHYELGLSYKQSGHLNAALAAFQMAYTHNPSQQISGALQLFQIASLQAQLGQAHQALTNLYQAIQWNPQLRSMALNHQNFAQLKTHPTFIQIVETTTPSSSQHPPS